MDSVTTQPFSDTPGAYTRREFGAVCARWWWVAAAPVAACAIMGATVDAVWYFVMLILIFTLLPAVLAFVWFYRSLSPEAAQAITPHTVTVSAAGIIVTPAFDDAWWHEHTFDVGVIKDVLFTSSGYVIRLKNTDYKHIAIPRTAVADADRHDFESLLQKFVPEMA